ncbi:MAG: TonB family protein [Candidatus Azobacteroides sp.]|nr:TonB family protein [Candidatus Azobacteroides sp.]
MKVTKEELYGYTGSGIFCLLIFLLLYFIVLKTTVKVGEEGILVNFGNVDLSSGTFEPKRGEPQDEITQPKPVQQPVPKPKTPPSVQQKPQKTVTQPITQNKENTAAIEAARKKQEEKKRLEAEQQAQRTKEAEEQRKRDAINQQVSGAFSSGTTGQNQRGSGTTGSGIQGNPESTSSVGSPSGSGYGEFNLGGRSLGMGGLPRPVYSVQEEGRIVINITVDPKGNVTRAVIGKGTNIDNESMRKSALEAAQKAKFNSISGNNDQFGTITYKYSLK